MEQANVFLQKTTDKPFDLEHRRKISFNMSKYDLAVGAGKGRYADLELARERANHLKWKSLEQLEQYLLQFETNFTANGGKVLWANDAEEALKEVLHIFKKVGARSVVKSKSMVTEEIHLNPALEKNGIEVVETDLGEFIQQLDEEPPYHIVTPAMHKSKEDIADLFHRKLNTAPNLSPEELTNIARQLLREKYVKADVGITGGNFIIADTGSIAITENEGNARLSMTFPRVHIAIVGIEKVIPSINDLDLFWPLLASHGTGQHMTVYNSILSGPRQAGETDGPQEMYVILLDNNRTNILADTEQRQSLYCIRCGACLNACPVYKNIGGHSYGTTYSGPIGSVITPHLQGMAEFKHLSQASSLCGNCTAVCPVKIDLHELLLVNRKQAVTEQLQPAAEQRMWKYWKKGMMSRRLMDIVGGAPKNFLLKYLFKGGWGPRRELPLVAVKSFNKQWRERHPNK
ncbi:MAG: LutB/LldF family L-lactate oxidation iron-sulfur protein [Sphingobacteriaceae bacterium]|nr:LutB/LldF family L-lactate oxidation iron-sulfur protein [Sphingobacteriaceae bacterium]